MYRDYDREHTLKYEGAVTRQQQQLDALALSVKQQLEELEHEQKQNMRHQQVILHLFMNYG